MFNRIKCKLFRLYPIITATLAARAAGGGAGGVSAALWKTGDGLPRPRAGCGARARAGGGGRCHLRGRLAVHGGRDPNLSAEGTR